MATTTLVAAPNKNPKTTLYVGGLEESVNESTLHAAFIPFGDVKDVNIPIDHATGKHRGFGFVEFEEKEDATAAIDNMHNAELFGRVLKVRACTGCGDTFLHACFVFSRHAVLQGIMMFEGLGDVQASHKAPF